MTRQPQRQRPVCTRVPARARALHIYFTLCASAMSNFADAGFSAGKCTMYVHARARLYRRGS